MSKNPQRTVSRARTQIPEFDFLLGEFSNMQHQIGDLFKEVQQKEKIRADLEVEKLLYQINPHFLMNTLDTVHWLAVMNGQGEIDKLVQSLEQAALLQSRQIRASIHHGRGNRCAKAVSDFAANSI